MAEISTIARPYAEALFRVAVKGDLKTWASMLDDLAEVAGHPDMEAVNTNPKLSADQVYAVFEAAMQKPLFGAAQNFVMTLIDNGRLSVLPEIAKQFHALKNAKEGSADAEIASAFELTPEQLQDLITSLEKKFRTKLHPSVTVDSSLIGGVKVVVGDQVLDSSVRSRLEQMRVALTA